MDSEDVEEGDFRMKRLSCLQTDEVVSKEIENPVKERAVLGDAGRGGRKGLSPDESTDANQDARSCFSPLCLAELQGIQCFKNCFLKSWHI